jgi:hypothetical protein
MSLEILDVAFVLLRGPFSPKGAEIPAFARFWVFLARIEPILAACEFADHERLRPPLQFSLAKDKWIWHRHSAAINSTRGFTVGVITTKIVTCTVVGSVKPVIIV